MTNGNDPAANKGKSLAALTPDGGYEIRSSALKAGTRPLGSQLSPLRRPSRLMENSRLYTHGDPIQSIDWRAYARTDQLLVRHVRDEATAKVLVVLDLSPSMHWPDGRANPSPGPSLPDGPSKAEIALRIGLSVAWIHRTMGDDLHVWAFFGEQDLLPTSFYPFKSVSEINQIFDDLKAQDFRPQAVAKTFNDQHFEPKKFDLGYWVGDCLGRGDYSLVLESTRRAQLFQVLSSYEIDLSWINPKTALFDDSRTKKEFQGKALLENQMYQTNLQQWIGKIKQSLTGRGHSHALVSEHTPIDLFLRLTEEFIQKPKSAAQKGVP